MLFWGFTLRNTARKDRCRLALLGPRRGDVVLDVACGPGNTTRTLLPRVGADGLAVGVDSSATMLAQAVRENTPTDGVGCYGTLDPTDDPLGALREMIRVLKPGGRIAALTTCARGPAPVRRAGVAASRLAPLRLFDVDDVTDVLRDAGLIGVTRNLSAASQTVGGRKPEAS